jgi:hypothetical protein
MALDARDRDRLFTMGAIAFVYAVVRLTAA